jgi:hypothetical protein
MSRRAGELAHKIAAELRTQLLAEQTQPKTYRLVPVLVKAGSTTWAKVDIIDFDNIIRTIWRLSTSGYAKCDGINPRMHRRIMETKLSCPLSDSDLVDHKNRNKLDNRRANLRLATKSQNGFNALQKKNVSGYAGVIERRWKTKTTYSARINYYRQVIVLGTFDDPIEAAYVRDQAALQFHGDFARLNVL